MKPTLSRLLAIGYPTLEIALAELEREGQIEKHNEMLGGYRVARGFAFKPPSPKYPSQCQLRKRERDAEKAARAAVATKAREEAKIARLAEIERRSKEIAQERAERDAEWEVRKIAARTAVAKARESRRAEIAVGNHFPSEHAKPGPKPQPAPVTKKSVSKAPMKQAAMPPAPLYDPWAILRARANAKPALIPGAMRQTPERMTARR